MNAQRVELLPGEKILFESDFAVLTDQRLVANWNSRRRQAADEAALRDIAGFRRMEGGQPSRLKTAFQFLVPGIAILIVAEIFGDTGTGSDEETINIRVSLAIMRSLVGIIDRLVPGILTSLNTGFSSVPEPESGTGLGLQFILFTIGSIVALIGLYILVSDFFRNKPHTTVIFQVRDAKEILVAFPGQEHPDADRLVRRFVRAKRRA